VSRHFDDVDAILEFDALDDLWQLVFALQSPPCFRGCSDELEHHELGGLRRQGTLRPHGSVTHCREHAFDRIRGAQMVSMLGGEVEEGDQSVPVLGQAGDRLLISGRVFFCEHVDGGFGLRSG
jgi:hypothetical protein